MYATANQLDTYRTVQKTTMSGREIEAAALTKAALRLKDCQNNWEAEDRNSMLAEALRLNQMVWTIFQSELAKEDNPLPKQLKQDILSLSIFIDKRIIEVLSDPLPEKLNIIIDINMNIAAGLRGR
ncbi:MAG: flagellar biosynthesis regulator FlaF [Nitrospiraceae bacterium]|nr:flagellar biosynthesis regulator FlaF [Nitrospiraceae bacterium]